MLVFLLTWVPVDGRMGSNHYMQSGDMKHVLPAPLGSA